MDLIGRVDKGYISSINFLDQPDLLAEVLDTTSEMRTVVDIMDMCGRFVTADGPEYRHFVNDYVFAAGTITAIDATKTGARSGATNLEITVTVQDASQLPVVTESVMFPNGRIGWVNAIDKVAKKFTAQALDQEAGSELSPAADAVGVGDVCIYFTDASGEGSRDPEGRKPRWNPTANYVQIFKESASVTDLQKASKMQVKYAGKPYVMYKIQHDTLLRHRAKIAFGLLAGRKAKFINAKGETVYMTQGLHHYLLEGDRTEMTTGGVQMPLAGAAIGKTDLKTFNRQLDKAGTPKETWWWLGGDLKADMDDLFMAMEGLTAGGIQYNSFGNANGKQKALDLGVNSVRIYGRTAHLKTVEAFDHPEVFGAAGFNFSGSGYVIPTGKIKVDHGSKAVERLRIKYLSGDGTNLKHMETLTGKLAPTPTDDEAVLRVGYESVWGLEALGISQFGLILK